MKQRLLSPRALGLGAAIALSVIAISFARAETVQLQTGETLEGDVRVDGNTLVVTARFPDVRTITLQRRDLTPESLFAILERRRDPHDAAQRRALAEVAEELGLLGAAVAEYRAAIELDPEGAAEARERIVALFEAIATEHLEDAKALLEDGMPRAAIRYLHIILERYPKTKASTGAQALMGKAHALAGATADVARKTVTPEQAGKLADKVDQHLQKGRKARAAVSGHAGAGGSSDKRSLLRAIDHFEDAWSESKRFPTTDTGAADLDARLRALHAQARSLLLEGYLAAGTMLLERRAIPSAERYCNKACELDPDGRAGHDLHRLILDAKLVYLPQGAVRRGGATGPHGRGGLR